MKLKISPTSPKNTISQTSEIDSLYKDHLQTIQKPSERKSSTPLWLLFLVVIIGFVSGIIGLIALLAYGSDIAILNKLPFFSSGLSQTIITTGQTSTRVAAADIQKAMDTISASVVSVYESQSEADGLAAAYSGDHLRGNGFVLTDDGYIVTTREIVSGSDNLAVMTPDGEVHAVEGRVIDPSTQLAFLKIKATGLTSVGINTLDNLAVLQEVIILKQLRYKESPVVGVGMVAAVEYQANALERLTALSSENISRTILLSERLAAVLDSGVVFSPSGEALGMLVQKDAGSVVEPFTDAADIMTQVVSGRSIIRPYLGIHYIHLAVTPGLPASLSQGLSQGALIYSDDEQDRPSIVAGSPAQAAHLKKGDIIMAIDSQTVDARHSLESIILGYKPQDSITVKVMRDKTELSLTITIGEYKD